MAIDTTMLGTDFGTMLTDWGTSVTVQGNSACTGLVQDLTVNDDLLVDGYNANAEVEIQVKTADVATLAPVPGNTVVVGSNTYRILDVLSAQGDVVTRMMCGEAKA